jgi:aquaporin Z
VYRVPLTAAAALRRNWPEYLIECWGLGTFMVSAAMFSTLLEYPGSGLHRALPSADLRRALIGIAMGITAIGIIYSPWGKRSGAHLNPSVTLTFLVLGKVQRWDAMFYVLAQFVGGLLGVLSARWLLGMAFTGDPVNYAVTQPGHAGVAVAFFAEMVISFGLMLVVLAMSSSDRLARYTGLAAGMLVATYITLEAPLSGMSMNPARTLASALPGSMWAHLWVYFTAPVTGMLGAAALHVSIRGEARCAKLFHSNVVRCIHCGYDPQKNAGTAHELVRL